ncbi:hypothetical protein JCM18909_3142 [Cutibacterium acnes JCM 18909]|nr:hypothetical protein JCM18909_3142 [Cutibacterium acnes JCM 18909]
MIVQLLLPFVLGQLSRRWTADFVTEHRKPLKYVDQGSIILVVYSAFSEGMREHMWSLVSPASMVVLTLICLTLLFFMLWLTWTGSGWLGFNRDDRIAIQFCGTKKIAGDRSAYGDGALRWSTGRPHRATPHDLPPRPAHRLRNAGWPLCAAMGGRAVTDRS